MVRAKRQHLTPEYQRQAGEILVEQAHQLNELHAAQHIALYLTVDGELNTQPLIDKLWQQKKSVYLPVIHPFSAGHLLFLHYQPDTEMVLNRYQILEPKLKKELIIPPEKLDIIFTPLVAFDATGQRLGMGGGYYDRTLAPWFQSGSGAIPIGLAHDCQYVDALPTQAWDVPLPKIVTPSKIWTWD
jgi:5-formyltetrahydrofolate cyclo-ligase